MDNDLARLAGHHLITHGPTRSAPHRFIRAQGKGQRSQLDAADIANIWQITGDDEWNDRPG